MIAKKVAIVTGGSSGIGRATCINLAKEEFHVVVVGTNPERVQQTLNLLEKQTLSQLNPPYIGLTLDVSQEPDMQEMANKTVEHFGRIDLLVASAGVGKRSGSKRFMPEPTASLSLLEWNEIININLTGIFLSNRAVIPVMIAQGVGHIINICSSTTPRGLRGQPYAPAYCASKFGVVGFTESLAAEVSSYGIRVQALFPGYVNTPMVSETALLQRYGGSMSADDVAATVVYLAKQPTEAIVVHPHLIPFTSIK
ncbi:SDR family oxidoreductase [Planktothrix sp. FACHB-1355]|uniref:SDR family oxidoreductase n=1 Tax=Aerosakkonema funiforme FACHB-1375 TaxID=2949571 RepID=A0A926VG25_9CYAN|nr:MULTISPECIES: SDR family oxidoreductase [Oscillatoriales]MBD2183265.1 SDR family oxidoreductase [Aerosakkonema funiforme FACHB-1375]MBD3560745.1 SDR family oxidoreductase [Planktothrix sp. FACHB-1355]